MHRIGECNRCGLCCGDDEFGWCEWLEGRPPNKTRCTHPNWPGALPCGGCPENGGYPYEPAQIIYPECGFRFVEDGD